MIDFVILILDPPGCLFYDAVLFLWANRWQSEHVLVRLLSSKNLAGLSLARSIWCTSSANTMKSCVLLS